MRRMSFMLTETQYVDGSKDVTRRLGWLTLKPGDKFMGVNKAMKCTPDVMVTRIEFKRIAEEQKP